MGALHAGHRSLVEAARRETGFVVVSIFVNPTQFGPGEDFSRYPRTLAEDVELCRDAGADIVFNPTVEEMYPAESSTYVEHGQLSTLWEGAVRPGHFRGVTTVVLKLLNAVQPDIAWFGQKDYQQLVIIEQMARQLLLDVEIRRGPTIRDLDGLALSSRNRYLSPTEREAGLALPRALQAARTMLLAGEKDVGVIRFRMQELLSGNPLVRTDYATIVDPRTLVELRQAQQRLAIIGAIRVGSTRLIDNELVELTRW
jgi:pantoate--beta-alanine ligase